MFVERSRQPLEGLRGDLAGDAGADHAPADEGLELRGVALRLVRPGAEGETVAEGEDHRARRQALQLGALAACRGREHEREDEQTRS
jgi:hypothetical protein